MKRISNLFYTAFILMALIRIDAVLAQDDQPIAPVLEGLGRLHSPVTTTSARAQMFFDQGLRMLYGFNHAESDRSFREAARLDPTFAMAYWGHALALGPNINDYMSPERELKAVAALEKARKYRKKVTQKERDFIEALSARYDKKLANKSKDMSKGEYMRARASIDHAYMAAMKALAEKYPDDPEAGTLYAAAIMNTYPWDYWTNDGAPTSEKTPTVLRTLETVIAKHPNHPGAPHYYIHIVEASQDPDRAVPSADLLGGLMPGAGHLVHMPSHIFIRVGRYADASAANVSAIAADESYIEQCQAQGLYPIGYYPHNIHFLWSASTLEGRSRSAIDAAKKVGQSVPMAMMGGYPSAQNFLVTPLFSYVRFGRWDEILNAPKPEDSLPFATAIWHYARALAHTAKGDLGAAQRALTNLEALMEAEDFSELSVQNNTGEMILKLATYIVTGELAAKQGDIDQAIQHLKLAVILQDNMIYSEPAPWHMPVRHNLGAVLMDAGRHAEAEEVYRKDLEKNRNNGYALFGLLQSLRTQGKSDEATEVERRLRIAWARADVILTSSRY